MTPPHISVVVPVYGCRDCLSKLHERLCSALEPLSSDFEIILVNDASPDQSWELIQQLAAADQRVKGIQLSRNFGQHPAIFAGLRQARGNYIVVMDCDLQDDPAEIPKLYAKILEGYDAVLGRRSSRQDSWLKRKSSQVFYSLLSFFTDSRLDPSIANFGIYRPSIIRAVESMGDKIRFFPVMIQWVGFKTASIEILHQQRHAGDSSYSPARLLSLAANVVLSFSNKPLTIIINLGFAVSSLSLVYAAWIFYRAFEGGVNVPGWASVTISIWFLGGIQIIVAGIVGTYIGKIFDASKDRPVYLIQETLNIAEPR